MRGAAVADLDHQSVEEHDRVDVLQRPLLPGSDVIHDRVGDAADEVVPDLDTIELGQVRLNVAHRHPAGVERDDLLVEPHKAPLPLTHDLRLKAPIAVARSFDLNRPVLGAAITLLGGLLRAFFLYRYRPALLGFPDSVVYVIDAHQSLFADPLRVSGYALFLRLLHAISPHLLLVTIVQHGLGLLGGLLLFDSVRRADAPIGLGLIPAAIVILGGSEIMLEHALLTDSLFIFLVNLALWFVVRAWKGSPWWALGAGLSLGCATIDRTAGLELLPVMLLCLLLAPASTIVAVRDQKSGRRRHRPGALRRLDGLRVRYPLACWRLTALVVGVVGALLVIFPFIHAHKEDTGTWGFASTSYFDLYGRVAPWANCSKFTPPPGTAKLCIHTPVSQRQGTEAWEFLGSSPAVAAYGSPEWFGPPPQKDENTQLRSFAIAAIEGQPFTYLEYVGRDLLRVVDPTFSTSPYKAIGNAGYGQTPEGLLNYYFNTSNFADVDAIITGYYQSPGLLAGNVDILKTWDRDRRIEGPVMVLILILALLAPILARGLPRRFAILCGLVSLVLIVGPILVIDYDWRFMIPVFGPLTAGAAIGGFEVWRRMAPAVKKLRRAPQT